MRQVPYKVGREFYPPAGLTAQEVFGERFEEILSGIPKGGWVCLETGRHSSDPISVGPWWRLILSCEGWVLSPLISPQLSGLRSRKGGEFSPRPLERLNYKLSVELKCQNPPSFLGLLLGNCRVPHLPLRAALLFNRLLWDHGLFQEAFGGPPHTWGVEAVVCWGGATG